MPKNSRLIHVALFHAIFSNFGDIEANIMNYMAVPVRKFFALSLHSHYGINSSTSSAEFELIYSSIASTFFVGVLFGAFSMGNLMENWGRKGTSVYIRSSLGVLSPACMILGQYINSIELFVVGQFLAGVLAAYKVVLFIYMTECAPDETRGFMAMSLGAGGNLLLLFVSPFCLPQVFGNDHGWWSLPAFCLLLAMIHLFVANHFPESPKHLYIAENKREEALASVRFYHGENAEIEVIIDEYEREKRVMHNHAVTMKEIFRNHRLRWSLVIVMLAAMVPATSLINLKSQYLEPMLMNFGLDQSKAMLATMLMTAVTSPLCLMAPFLVEKFGRRPLFIFITLLSTLELVFVGVAQALVDVLKRQGGSPDGSWFIPTVGIFGCFMGGASSMLGMLNMTSILVGELCPHAARAIITQIMQVIPMFWVLLLVICYPIVLLVLLCKYLPETKGLPVDQIFRSLQPSDDSTVSLLTQDQESISSYGAIEDTSGGSTPALDQL
uniref:Major facilitator superfamily (MFS) profile domain-containing protein n=1 Tax=Ditylenchus dipsaci TaxID=166011 RepID=A0A915D762_9BILA